MRPDDIALVADKADVAPSTVEAYCAGIRVADWAGVAIDAAARSLGLAIERVRSGAGNAPGTAARRKTKHRR